MPRLTTRYRDGLGQPRETPAASATRIEATLNAHVAPCLDPVCVSFLPDTRSSLRAREALAGCLRIVDEDGSMLRNYELTPSDWSPAGDSYTLALDYTPTRAGYLSVQVESTEAQHRALWLVAPARQTVENPRRLGVFSPVYAASSEAQPSLRSLATLAQTLKPVGVGLIGTLPLFPSFAGVGAESDDASPYSPITRLLLNECWASAPAIAVCAARHGLKHHELAAPPEGDFDYRHALQTRLRAICEANTPEGLAQWRATQPRTGTVADYARFRAAKIAPEAPAPFEAAFLLLQEAVTEDLKHTRKALAALDVLAYVDLPLGVSPEGFDALHHAETFLEGMSVGAPPDRIFLGGQDWGFAPMHPQRMRESGYAYLIEALRATLAFADLLRVDHIMGLERVYVVPHGAPASDGAYLNYEAGELYAVLLIEATRAGCRLIGEDLGTVPESTRQRLTRHGIDGMHILQHELHTPLDASMYAPATSKLCALNTHDMPTFAGWCWGDDLRIQEELALIDADEARMAREQRGALIDRLRDAHGVIGNDSLLWPLLEAIAPRVRGTLLIDILDLVNDRRQHNVPGTPARAGNWCHRPKHPLDQACLDALGRVAARFAMHES